MGITAIAPQPGSSKRHRAHPVFPYLLRGRTITRPNQVWAMDITYIPMARGFLFLAAVMDWASRRVLSWRTSVTLNADFCIDAVEDAIMKYGRPEIFNTDQGAQFTSAAFTGLLQDHGITISMDGIELLARQHLRRAPVALHQVRRGLPPRVRLRLRGARRHRALFLALQHRTATLQSCGPNPRRSLFHAAATSGRGLTPPADPVIRPLLAVQKSGATSAGSGLLAENSAEHATRTNALRIGRRAFGARYSRLLYARQYALIRSGFY